MTEPFNVDVNARRADYKHLPQGTVLVSKIFPTIQSEGPLAGTPAVFVRLAGCNIGAKEQCSFCDSQFFLKSGSVMPIAEIVKCVEDMRGARRLVVLTGGEPLLQPNAPQLIDALITDLSYSQVQIETNGYFWNQELQRVKVYYPDDFIVVVSPKVNQRQVYPDLPRGIPIDCLKVLVDADPASPYHKLPDYVGHFSLRVWLSPIMHYRKQPNPRDERVSLLDPDTPLDVERCQQNIAYATELAQKLNYRLSLQTHLFTAVE